MTDTPNLKLPYIDGAQAQKHVTHNEALRILDAAIQISVRDMTRTVPPASPVEGARYIVAAGAGGAWTGHGLAIATWQDGAWAFLVPQTGWCVWSIADDGMLVFDGALWRAIGSPSLDSVPHLGINVAADGSNLLRVKSNAALFAAIGTADAGTGDMRLQVSKETAAGAASVVFSDAYSGRAEFGLIGSDAFKLKVSPDGSNWIEAMVVDQASGNATLPRGLALSGVVAPAEITASVNDYSPAGLATAAVLQLSADAARTVSGLAGGGEGRIVSLINVGGPPITLLDDSAASAASNRFAFGGHLTLMAKQGALLRYNGTAARWQAISGGASIRADTAQQLSPTQQAQAQKNAGLPAIMRSYLAGLTLSTVGASWTFGVAAGVATDSSNADIMTLASACTKTTSAWAVGTAAGALDTGTIANGTWYHVHLIKRVDTGVVDVLISNSVASPTLPANYTLFRRIGSLKTDGSGNWIAFNQVGDQFIWAVPSADQSGASISSSSALYAVNVPPGVSVDVLGRVTFAPAATSFLLVQSPLTATQAANSPGGNYDISSTATINGVGALTARTNTSQQVRAVTSTAAANAFYWVTTGWTDRRGRDS